MSCWYLQFIHEDSIFWIYRSVFSRRFLILLLPALLYELFIIAFHIEFYWQIFYIDILIIIIVILFLVFIYQYYIHFIIY